MYRTWWAELEACSRRSATFERIDWRSVEDGDDGMFPCRRLRCAGAWQPPHSIFLAESQLLNEPLVKHEMLHDLLQSAHHLSQPFVSCQVAPTDRS